MLEFHKTTKVPFFVLKYEDFVNRNLSELENYLDFELTGSSNVPNEHKRVERTKRAGDWENWFTNYDIKYYKPLFREYMERYGYGNWNLPDVQNISPDHGTTYILRLVKEARRGELSPYNMKADEKITKLLFNFDWIDYLCSNPELVSKGIYTKWGALRHWLLYRFFSRCYYV